MAMLIPLLMSDRRYSLKGSSEPCKVYWP